MAPKTIKQALKNMLADLKPEDFKKFCGQLVDRRKEPRVRRNKVHGKDFLDIAEVLVTTFTEQGALDVAVEILRDIDCNDDADRLVEETRGLSSKPGSTGTKKRCYPERETQRPSTTPSPSSEREDIRPRPQGRTRQERTPSYKMDAIPCGHCLIINNVEFEPQTKLENRTGSNIDCDKLKNRFKAFKFIVEVKTNLKQEQIKHELSALSKKDHSRYDCCVVIILSHGTETKVSQDCLPGAVYGVDGVPVDSITDYLNGQHCPTLQGKPKLFFIQACGGGKKDTGFEVSPDEVEPSFGGADDQMDTIPMSSSSDSLSMSAEPDTRVTLPTPSDILVSYSTFPGYMSWSVPQTGSLYVETLDRILEENAATVDLVRMLKTVKKEVSENPANLHKQRPGSFGFLRKRLYFKTQEQRQY